MACLFLANRVVRAVVSDARFVPARPGLNAPFAVGVCGRLVWDNFWLGIDATVAATVVGTAGVVAGCAAESPTAAVGVAMLVGYLGTALPAVVWMLAAGRVGVTVYRGKLHCVRL